MSGMDLTRLSTERLELAAVSEGDLDELHALNADPRVWRHLPSGAHTDVQQTRDQIADYTADWERDGLGYWIARRGGELVGIGGVRRRPGGTWNLYYRIAAERHGHGYATEVARAGVDAAARLAPDEPVVAYLLEHNEASRRTAERVGLGLVWRGPDHEVPDGIRLVLADRTLDEATLGTLH